MVQNKLFSLTTVIVFLLLLGSNYSTAQSFSFNTYQIEDGICDRFVYTINQDRYGYLWLGTGGGLCRYDGFTFRSDIITDSIPQGYVRCSYMDSDGNLWFGHDDGSVSYYDGSNLHILNTSDFLYSRVNDILEDPEGNLLIATQNSGLLVINPKDTSDMVLKDIGPLLVYSVEFNTENNLVVGTQDSTCIFSYTNTEEVLPYIGKVDSLPDARFQKIFKDSHGEIYIGTADGGLFHVIPGTEDTPGFQVTNLSEQIDLERGNIQDIFEDVEGNIWLSTFRKGVYKLERSDDGKGFSSHQVYSTDNGLNYNDITSVYQDLEGNIWIGTYGNGLALLLNEAFLFYDYAEKEIGPNITSLYASDEEFWVGGEKGLVISGKDIEGESAFYPGSAELSESRITSVYPDPSGTIGIGTSNQGLFQFDKKTGIYTSVYYSRNSLENSINHLAGYKTEIWIATSNGILIYDYETDEMLRFSTRDGLPHNKINHIFIDTECRGWISTVSNRLYYVQDGKLSLGKEIMYYTKKNEFQAVAVNGDGDIWAATYGNGIYHFTEDSTYNYTVYDGLISDYCYSLLMEEENLWVGHRLGFSRVHTADTLITSYGRELGITSDCNLNAVVLDNDGAVMFGTNKGIIRYDPAKDKGSLIPPISNIISISFSDVLADLRNEIIMPFDRYKLKIDFIGLSYEHPELVTYQYKLENYDEEWSDLTRIPQVSYGIADGKE